MRRFFLFVCIVLPFFLFSQANFNERSRVAIGGGGTLAFKTIGGYNARAYLQFSQKWKMVLAATDVYIYEEDAKLTSKHRSFDFNILHAHKEYNDWDVFYLFEGLGAELWTRNKEPKLAFREITVSETAKDTIKLVPCLNAGVGFEKPIGPIGFYAELELRIGSPEWMSVTFGIKTNTGRIFKNPKKRYNLELEDAE
jgi:hypothetical protein